MSYSTLLAKYIRATQNPGIVQETEHGLSSNPDSSRMFPRSSQEAWEQFSIEMITAISGKIRAGENFEAIYRWSAKERQKIAVKLGHGLECWPQRQEHYGCFRRATHFESAQEVFLKDNTCRQAWKTQAGAVFKKVEELYESIREGNRKTIHFEVLPFKASVNMAIRMLSPFNKDQFEKKFGRTEHTEHLSYIEMILKYDGSISQIIIEYAGSFAERDSPDHALWEGDMLLANYYLAECKHWKSGDRLSAKALLHSIGRLSHLMASLLPVRLGNAGIMGWIQRAIALYCGIELGCYSQQIGRFDAPDPHNDNTISWDFMALVTPDREEYACWFSKYAFIDYIKKAIP